MNLTSEIMEKAKQAKSADELLTIAKENGMEMTEEEAKAYYAQLHPVSGEIADDELENVSGGGCHAQDGRLVVTTVYHCEGWEMNYNMISEESMEIYKLTGGKPEDYTPHNCNYCKYRTTEAGMHYCNNERNRK